MLSKTSLTTHNYRKHNKKRYTDEYNSEENSADVKCCKMDYFWTPGRSLINFNGSFNNNYFKIENALGLGNAFLVGQSQFKLSNIVEELSDEEVKLHHNIARLVCTLSKGQQYMLGNIIKDITIVLGRQSKEKKGSNVWQTRLPTTDSDIRKLYVHGKHAILPNLPRPKVQMVGSHAYVSLADCIADLLGHGCNVDCVTPRKAGEPITNISQSKRAQSILQNSTLMFPDDDVMVLYLVEWSDGFEPSLSVKSNRGSCWLKTVTISPPPHLIHSCCNTYPIALGMDGESHEEVERLFAEELRSFKAGKNNIFYHGGLKRNVRVYIELFASLQDQPERRKANYVMLGRSTYTAQWGLLLDFAAVASHIPGCETCMKTLLMEPRQSINHCKNCVNWNTSSDSRLLDYSPPVNYPTKLIPQSGKLSPQKITYKVMKEAVEIAHNGIVFEDWKASTLTDYLRVHGLNEEAIQSIKQRAFNCRKYNSIIRTCNGDETAPSFEAVIREQNRDPSMFEMWKFPAFWSRDTDILQHIDVAMHLIFLGVVKTVMQQIHDWMITRNKGTRFVQFADTVFDTIEQLKLSWCRITSYKNGNFGGWISENYVAAAKLMCWFYAGIGQIAADPVFDEPDIELKYWRKTHHYAWLKIRGLDTTGTACELKHRVEKYLKQRGGPPDIPEPAGGPVQNVLNTVSALRSMISRLMIREVTEASLNDLERHIKIFLNAYEVFDRGIRKKDVIPTWVSSYNFCCLLNYPNVIREFGPIRNLWEGGGMGEKVLRLVKPNWYGFRKNWQVNKLDQVLRKMSMIKMSGKTKTTAIDNFEDKLTDDHGYLSDSSSDEHDCITHDDGFSGLAKVYKNKEEVFRMYQTGSPLSVLQLNCGRFHILCKNDITVQVEQKDYVETICGSSYHKWTLVENSRCIQSINLERDVKHCCLLLPKLSPLRNATTNGSEYQLYTLIDSDWNVIQQDGSISLPRVEKAIYSDT